MDAGDGSDQSGRDTAPDRPAAQALDDALARDWVTVWQSEMAAIAVDREVQEAWLALLGIAPEMAADEAAGAAGADASSRTAAVDAASERHGDTVESLRDRVVALERRLAELGRQGPTGQD